MRNGTDHELMKRIAEKHRPALEELYDRYARLVYSFALKATRDEAAAREIVQLVYTRLWTTGANYDPEKGQFVNWLITITRNMTVDYLRRQRRHRAAMRFEPREWERITVPRDEEPESVLGRRWMREQIREAYRYLSENQIRLLEMLYWEGYTLSEISERCEEPLGTIKSRLHQCLKVLRRHLMAAKEG